MCDKESHFHGAGDCKVEFETPPEVVSNVRQILGKFIPTSLAAVMKLYKGQGCNFCGNTGYLGRTGIYEVLVITDQIAKLILEHAASGEIEEAGVAAGMITMKQDGYLKVLEGITTMEEVLRVAQD